MTREEEILEAARERADRHQIAEMELYKGDKCNYSYGRILDSEIVSFEAGVKWADNHPINVWYDATEEPQQDRLMLGIDCDGASIYKWIEQDPNGWSSFIKDTYWLI